MRNERAGRSHTCVHSYQVSDHTLIVNRLNGYNYLCALILLLPQPIYPSKTLA